MHLNWKNQIQSTELIMHRYAIVALQTLAGKEKDDFERKVRQAGPKFYPDYGPTIYFVQSSSSPRTLAKAIGFSDSSEKITGFVTKIPGDAYNGYASQFLCDFLAEVKLPNSTAGQPRQVEAMAPLNLLLNAMSLGGRSTVSTP